MEIELKIMHKSKQLKSLFVNVNFIPRVGDVIMEIPTENGDPFDAQVTAILWNYQHSENPKFIYVTVENVQPSKYMDYFNN